jgi:D-lactate dehydrogenase
MRIVMFDTHAYDRHAFVEANTAGRHDILFLEPRLTVTTAPLAAGAPVVCSFVNDRLDAETIGLLASVGVRLIALRSAGFNHVDLNAAGRNGIAVVRVPAYSPYAVAEHAVGLILALNRKLHRAYARVREGNFSLEGLVGFDLHGRTVGVIGTGQIGTVMVRILRGFGCRVLAFDLMPSAALGEDPGVRYVSLAELYRASDIVTLHVPLTPDTVHMIGPTALAAMKPGVFLINTSRGALVDTPALIEALKRAHVGAAGLDVYEEEAGVFFNDLSEFVLQDDVLARLLTFPNVLITSHQGFLTRDALANIADVTLTNIDEFAEGRALTHQVRPDPSPVS